MRPTLRFFSKILFLLALFGGSQCAPGLQRSFWQAPPDLARRGGGYPDCRDLLAYAPDTLHLDQYPVRTLRLNFHIVQRADGSGNFPAEAGRAYIHELLRLANDKLEQNSPMRLPLGNRTPVLPMRYRYVLSPQPGVPGDDGIYVHRDEELFYMVARGKNRNNFSRSVITRYAVRPDSVINIFLLEHHPDSLRSPSYKSSEAGIALGNHVKIMGWHHNYEHPRGGMLLREWFSIKMLHHEIGHVLGLSHTWSGNDGCDDTPNNPNCFSIGDEPPCDQEYSNNLMDYNFWQEAWTPCQIGTIHRNIADPRHRIRAYVEADWCRFDPAQSVHIRKDTHWAAAKDLGGDLIVHDGATLRLSCRLSLPEGGKIVLHPRAVLALDGAHIENACGQSWAGIELLSRGGRQGEVRWLSPSWLGPSLWSSGEAAGGH